MSSVVNLAAIGMLFTSGVTIAAVMLRTAPYGRYSTTGWGPLVPARPAWLVMEIPNLIIALSMFLFTESPGASSFPNRMLFYFFLVHYIHRAVIYPLLRKPKISSPMPLSLMLMAFVFCTWNGWMQSYALLTVYTYPPSWCFGPRFLFGMSLAIFGMTVNIRSDSTLLQLRKSGRYDIPTGGLFRFVSCANYLGEVLEWTGFAIACWSLPALAFAIYTASNLVPRALSHHGYYKQRFGVDYPKERTAIIPFVL